MPFLLSNVIIVLEFNNRLFIIGFTFQYFSTNECQLTEPVYGHQFDFRNLHSDLAHSIAGHFGDIFEFNVCGNLTKVCNGQSEVAACLRRSDNTEIVLGKRLNHSYYYDVSIFNRNNL